MTAPENTAAVPRTAVPPGTPAAGADTPRGAGADTGAPASRNLDFTLLAVAIAGVSMSAPLIAATAAPALAIAFWRNAIAVGVLSPVALWRHRAELRGMGRRALTLSGLAGVVLALHFGMWLPSLSMTSVATSTALVTTTPIWTTLILRLRGHRPPRLVWAGTVLAVAGVLILTGIDLSTDTRALEGDALALGAGLAAAGYMLLGVAGAAYGDDDRVHVRLLLHHRRGAAGRVPGGRLLARRLRRPDLDQDRRADGGRPAARALPAQPGGAGPRARPPPRPRSCWRRRARR